jgi:hypothetical protein
VDQPLTQPVTSKPNWWNRNWKWFVPLGCFTVAVLFFAFVGSILVIVFGAMKSIDRCLQRSTGPSEDGSRCD